MSLVLSTSNKTLNKFIKGVVGISKFVEYVRKLFGYEQAEYICLTRPQHTKRNILVSTIFFSIVTYPGYFFVSSLL